MLRMKLRRITKPVVGITDKNTLMLDLDNISKTRALEVGQNYLDNYNMKGFMLLKSSNRKWHIVFDKWISWAMNKCLMSVCPGIRVRGEGGKSLSWFELQMVKGASTLRISEKGIKPQPKIVMIIGEFKSRIKRYIDIRNRLGLNDFYARSDKKEKTDKTGKIRAWQNSSYRAGVLQTSKNAGSTGHVKRRS